jgi:hypothetical protein
VCFVLILCSCSKVDLAISYCEQQTLLFCLDRIADIPLFADEHIDVVTKRWPRWRKSRIASDTVLKTLGPITPSPICSFSIQRRKEGPSPICLG